MSSDPSPQEFAQRFALPGEPAEPQRFPGGHINDSFLVSCDGCAERFLLQRINGSVFPRPDWIMDNIARVSAHVQTTCGPERPFLQLIPTQDEQPAVSAPSGDLWRMYSFIEGATMRESAASPFEAAEAGRAVGEFQRLLADLPGPRLHEVIPEFHHTPKRYSHFREAVAADAHARAAGCADEIAFALSQEGVAGTLVEGMASGALAERAVHNDAKMSNVLLDAESGQALCVVDLDTVMPGSVLYDFGDMMRTMLCAAPEDETDLSQVRVDLEMFEALTAGYLSAARPILNEHELELMVLSGILITLETGLRFLDDHLRGDGYFRVHRPGQNLDRARTQFALVRSMQEHRVALEASVRAGLA